MFQKLINRPENVRCIKNETMTVTNIQVHNTHRENTDSLYIISRRSKTTHFIHSF